MLDEIRQGPLFAQVPEEKVPWILEQGEEYTLLPGEVLFAEGDPARCFYVLLAGQLQITKRINGQDVVLAVHTRPGSFTGEVPLLTGTAYVATARSLGESRVQCFDEDTFRAVLAACPAILKVVLSALSERIQNMEITTMQQEKLAALGKLSAGLAHELNNPAAAGQRAVGQLRETFLALPELTYKLYSHGMTPQLIADLQQQVHQRAVTLAQLDPVTQSDREDELAAWLEEHKVAESWQLAPTFVSAGLDIRWFTNLATCMDDSALGDFVLVLERTLQVFDLFDAIEQSTGRISTLVKAIKSYSYMDQAPLQEIDIHEGLESTLTMLHYKLRNITVTRQYDQTLPRICAYGSELNQVWTNLLDNACDALQGQGNIWLRTRRENELVVVEVADDGPGIPKELQSRIFEPFFTTKGVGKGSGLGLDIAYRIVARRHHGDLQVTSQPGSTCFSVRLPLQQ